MNCQDFNNLLKLSDFLHFNEIWPMFPPNPMYETNAIQLHFLLWFFWYISQWSGWISSIFCTRLYSKDIHCALKTTYILFKLPYYFTPVHKFLNALPNTLGRPMCNLWYIKDITYWPNFHDFLLSDFLFLQPGLL